MSALRQLLDRYEAHVSGDEQGLLGELVVALARDALAPRSVPFDPETMDAIDKLWDAVNELTEALATLTRDHNGLVLKTASAVGATPTHADLRQLASAVSALATRVTELESAGRDHEDTIRFLTQALRERTEERDHARRENARLRAELAEERAMADALGDELRQAQDALRGTKGDGP